MYQTKLDLIKTEMAITVVRDEFERQMRETLSLKRISAPLFLNATSGLNDNLNGVEEPVNFMFDHKRMEIVHSLAKWKRHALGYYQFKINDGLYTNMNAIRKDESLDNIHSIYVDQWDWERVITKDMRHLDYLKQVVKEIYEALKNTEKLVIKEFPCLKQKFADEIFFITSQELEDMYPNHNQKEREDLITKKHRAVFIMQIGDILKSGQKHDGRSPDYDDWNLNGDILVYNDIIDRSFELSSMGIRVDEETLVSQLKKAKEEKRLSMPFHQAIMQQKLPYTIGGGIGQSRLCMFILEKAHIGEVQASYWPDSIINQCVKENIFLL